jgi:hypothetical protein
MDNSPRFSVTKLEAARRQLEVAIELWFFDRDAVSIHTLASAAYQVLADLSKDRGLEPMLTTREGLKDRIRPGMEAEAYKMFSEAENFFKHADRDPNETIEFRPGSNQPILWEASARYRELTGERVPALEAMYWWFILTHPQYYILPEHQLPTFTQSQSQFVPNGKQAFFRDYLTYAKTYRP